MPGTRKYALMRGFNMTLEGYEELQKKQHGTCAICLKPEASVHKGKVRSLAVDHCHNTDRVRGLLCMRCNQALGLLREDIDIMLSAIDYLRKHKQKADDRD